ITTNYDIDGEIYSGVQPDTWTKYDDIPVFYFSKDKMSRPALLNVIHEAKPDLVYLNSLWSYFFSILPLRLKKNGRLPVKMVLAPRGMLGRGALSIKPLKKKLFLFLSKLTSLHKAVIFQATTSDEEKEIRQVFGKAIIKIAPNVNATAAARHRNIIKTPGELRLVYLSRIVRIKNLHGALETLAALKAEGTITYDIYGAMEDPDYWKECESIIRRLPENIRVAYKGELGFSEVQGTIAKYHYLFLPTLNENFGHSIVESLLSGLPVIISDRTPWNSVNEHHCGAAVSPENTAGFIAALQQALALDAAAYSEISENCITFIEQRTDTVQNIKAYRQLFS
ncbi:MAG: glycosyltransferase, partial [Bacteroidia bacterium]